MGHKHICLSVQTETTSSTYTASQTDCQNSPVSYPGEHVTQALLRFSYTDSGKF